MELAACKDTRKYEKRLRRFSGCAAPSLRAGRKNCLLSSLGARCHACRAVVRSASAAGRTDRTRARFRSAPTRARLPAPDALAQSRTAALCLRGGGEVATPIDDDEDDDDIDDGDEDDMEDDDGDDDGDDGDDGDDDDEEEEEAVEESANDLDTGALKRLMIMGTITVAMHLFLPKVPDAPAEEEAAAQEEEPAAEEAAPSSEEEEAAEYVEEEEVRVREDEAEGEAAAEEA